MTTKQLELVWNETLKIIKSQLNTPTFKTWFKNVYPNHLGDSRLVVGVPSDFAKEWLENRYAPMLTAALQEVAGVPMDVEFEVNGAPEHQEEEPPNQEPFRRKVVRLSPKYTFDSFVIGSSNRFAHAAALAVAERPYEAYNPLFVYGGVGLGKTHLLQAIAHYVSTNHSDYKVKYVSTEQFTNDFINSIRDKGKIAGFQSRYRKTDVLLIDDIQFLEGKERTQEEFFHTFNTLYEANKQVVISSDRPPRDISTLEERLRSRFESGLITDIQPPDLETRIAILRKKAAGDNLSVPGEVLEYIASRIQSNIRELEGALVRVIAFSSLTSSPICLELSQNVLKDIFPEQSRPIGIRNIQKEVCRYYSVSMVDLTGNKRSQAIVFPRQVAMYLTRELTDLSLPRIGKEFGGRDHTTVMHANTKIEGLINKHREIYNQVQDLTNRIKRG
ncbi:MAG: chromosomal replication initiator protein DnaA [Actinobacteria bacterium]|nr:MAG: chromosomal replication initiator protein DnaA [Actinomycetota bacterium]